MVNIEFYKNAKVYKIVDNTNGNIYVGSTCKKLCQRLGQHRASYKGYLNNTQAYMSSFEIIKNNDYNIVLLEALNDCGNKEQLRKKERGYIETIKCVNLKSAWRDSGESQQIYNEKNQDKIKEYKNNYNEINQEKLVQYVK